VSPKTVAVQYLGPFDRVSVPALGVEVGRGESVTVSAAAAADLLTDEASWAAVTTDTEGE
jgi:hypothetical protein